MKLSWMAFWSSAALVGHWTTTTAVATTSPPVSNSDIPPGGTPFQHFIAMNDTQTCVGDVHAMPFNNQIRGTNLGGWMVLEPWITPSLFYQFLGRGEGSAAFDTYTFCEVLGAKEANRQLRQHWKTWVTEDIIKEMAQSGAVNSLRLPIGDYLYKPYGVYGETRWGI
jgi:glucan 1,3-beta-glucosidase